MKSRDFYLERFLRHHHLNLNDLIWLSGDASKRRYARLNKKGTPLILMDSPMDEKPKEFFKIDKLLRKHHLPAPKIYAKNLRHGFMLLEDFGSEALSQAIQKNKKSDDLYLLALDTLVRLQKNVKEADSLPPAYPVLLSETLLFTEYYVPKVLGIKLSKEANQHFERIWTKLLKAVDALPKCLVLYDYHLDNIMLKSDGSLGLLDFQDALYGPIFYDLVSFVEDERYPLPVKKRKALLSHYFELRPVLAEEKYRPWLEVVAAHRHTRVMGIFGRLASLYGHPEYLKYVKNDWAFLRENLHSPLLKEYKEWLKKYLPKQLSIKE